jgi:hypothetical protein
MKTGIKYAGEAYTVKSGEKLTSRQMAETLSEPLIT